MYSLGYLVSSIKNGYMASKLKVEIKSSKFILSIVEVLLYEGYIRGYTLNGYNIVIFLKYIKGKSVINDIKLISKPTSRVYYNFNTLKNCAKMNEIIFFTSNIGIKTNKEYSLAKTGVGGEGLFYIK